MTNENYMSDDQFNDFLKTVELKESRRGELITRDFFELDNGWLGIIKRLVEDLKEIGWDGNIIQCKEKFGVLNFYCNSLTEKCHERVRKAEEESYYFCETCGDPGNTKNISGWYSTLCKKHHEERLTKLYAK